MTDNRDHRLASEYVILQLELYETSIDTNKDSDMAKTTVTIYFSIKLNYLDKFFCATKNSKKIFSDRSKIKQIYSGFGPYWICLLEVKFHLNNHMQLRSSMSNCRAK